MYSSTFLYQAMVKAKCVWHSQPQGEAMFAKLCKLTLLLSSFFFNILHDAGKRDTMWHSFASLVSFLVHGSFKFQAGCCARWSSWAKNLRHFVKFATYETCESVTAKGQLHCGYQVSWEELQHAWPTRHLAASKMKRWWNIVLRLRPTIIVALVAHRCAWELSQLRVDFRCDKSL